MILKIIIFVVVVFLIYMIFFKKNRVEKNNGGNNSKKLEESMDECSSCKAYFVKNDGILSNGKYFCSNECVK